MWDSVVVTCSFSLGLLLEFSNIGLQNEVIQSHENSEKLLLLLFFVKLSCFEKLAARLCNFRSGFHFIQINTLFGKKQTFIFAVFGVLEHF